MHLEIGKIQKYIDNEKCFISINLFSDYDRITK
jgi:hypothetical protein